MAVAYGNASALASDTGTSVTVTKPTSTASGDVLLAVVVYAGTFSTETVACTGWTNAEHTYDSGNDTGCALLYRIAGGSEGASYAFTIGNSADNIYGQIYRFTGQSGGTPGGNPFKTASGVNHSTGSTSTIPSVTYDAEGTGLGVWIHVSTLGGNTVTNPSGYTERLDESSAPHRVVADRADTAGTGKTTGTGGQGSSAFCWAFGGTIIDSFSQSVNVGLVTETDTSQTAGRLKSAATGQPSTTDTAQAVTKIDPIWVAAGLVTTTDTAQAVTVTKAWNVATGLTTETDTAQAVTAQVVHKRNVGLLTETDTAPWLTEGVGLPATTDTSQAVGRLKSAVLGLGW